MGGKDSLLVLLAISACSISFAMVTPSETFSKSVSLVKDDFYHLFWKSDNTSITFEVHAKVKGWVGFGLSPTGSMENADIVIGWVKDGVSYFKVSFFIATNSGKSGLFKQKDDCVYIVFFKSPDFGV